MKMIDESKLSNSTLYCILMDLEYRIKDEYKYDVGGKMMTFEKVDVRQYLMKMI